MIGVLARLQWMTLKGRAVRSIRLLRQPKYLLGFAVGSVWFGLWMVRPLLHSRVSLGAGPFRPDDPALTAMMHRIVALCVTLILPLPWLLPRGPLGLPFREAELTLLLQAPLTRRQVIQYGLLKSEVGVVFGALALSLFRAGGGLFASLSGFVGTWLLLDFWNLNGRWRALFNLRQTEIPAAQARRRRLVLTLGLLGFYVVLCWGLLQFRTAIWSEVHGGGREEFVASLTGVPWPSLLVWLLTPAWCLTAPIFAGRALVFVGASIPVLLMIIAQREVVLRSKAHFEELALEQAQTRETKRSPTRRFAKTSVRARSRRPFVLGPPGSAAVAVLWKNAIRVSRTPWSRIALGASALWVALAVLPAVLRLHDATYGMLVIVGLFMMVFLPLGAGMLWNNDLRTELTHIELVRTWPVSARTLVLAEVVSPALLSFAGAVFGAGLVLTGLFGSRLREVLTGEPAQLVLLPRAETLLGVPTELAALVLFASFLPLAAALSFLSSALQNLAVVFAPAWMAHSADRSRGVAAVGQRMVSFSALGLALVLALIPSALLVGTALLVQGLLGVSWSAWEFPLWSALVAIPLLVGGGLVVQAAARLWERLDTSQEILEIGR